VRSIAARSARPARGALQPLEHALLVALGLQPPEQPGAGVPEALVVQVHRVLRREHHAEPVGARLLEQRQQRLLRRRVGHRREEAEDLVHVEQRAQARGAGLRAHPAEHLGQQQRDEEHPLGVREVRDGDDRDARLARRGPEQAADIQRLALEPGREAGGGEQVVERHRQPEALLRREERLQVEDADALHRRVLDLLDDAGEIEVLPLPPGGVEDRRQQDVLPALTDRRDPGECQDAHAGRCVLEQFRSSITGAAPRTTRRAMATRRSAGRET
jgi:hypothetical protein